MAIADYITARRK